MKRVSVTLTLLTAILAGIHSFSPDFPSQSDRDEGSFEHSDRSEDRPNVLFISIDDLGTWLGTYDKPYIHSPNIDRLAEEGMRFDRAYAHLPVCGASRASMWTGIYPTRNRYTVSSSSVEEDAPDALTLPQVFRENGYYTVSLGKIFHVRDDTQERSWSEPIYLPEVSSIEPQDPESDQYVSERGRGPVYEYPDVPDDTYHDGQLTRAAIDKLRELRDREEPFFLATGFVLPHLPFYSPKRYWDLYDRDTLPLAENPDRPKDAPEQLSASREFRNYHFRGMDENSEEFHRGMRHGYFAAVSYVDKLIGDILEELEELDFSNDTIIVLWGDHGFNLGENSFWGKHNLMHESLHIPLIIHAPGVTEKGSSTDDLVESVDLFPTLVGLAGLPVTAKLDAQWDGVDITPLLRGNFAAPREAVYTRWRRGDTVFTPRYSYTEYRDSDQIVNDRMLFDRWVDPGEELNLESEAEYKDDMQRLERQLKRLMKQTED